MLLYGQLGMSTVGEGLDLVESVYAGRPIQPKVQFLLEEIVALMRERRISSGAHDDDENPQNGDAE